MLELGYDILGRDHFSKLQEQMLDMRIYPFLLPTEFGTGGPSRVRALNKCVESLNAWLVAADSGQVRTLGESLGDLQRMFFDLEAAVTNEPEARRCMAVRWLTELTHRRYADGLWNPPNESRVWLRFPSIRAHVTPEGLLRIRPPLRLSCAGVHAEGHIIPLHPWFPVTIIEDPRRDLVARLAAMSESDANTVAIAIDWRAATPSEDYYAIHCRAFWYGPPLRLRDLDNPHAVGVTTHIIPDAAVAPYTNAMCMLHRIERAEFFWKHKEGVKTFQAEEVLSSLDRGPGRYLHAEYDLRLRAFRHIDGAFMRYGAHDATTRRMRGCILPNTPRATQKPKMFRLDGSFTPQDWSDVFSMFFRDNPLVREYISGESDPSSDIVARALNPDLTGRSKAKE